ncbi:MAG: hypothetical protein O2887_00605 [Bacteroidetes bacterium]|nr:hypothetical protein [Bacteroidota bacterium]MDA1118989.1 hypothetical protein [Bacteroidota bacterium]
MALYKKFLISLVAQFFVTSILSAQFIDKFDGTGTPAENGWRFATGDGVAQNNFVQKDGYASINVDATSDRQNIWWALIAHQATGLDMKKLVKPGYELRVEARIRVSHAPRRVNLHVNHQRTTDFHSHLMEYDIPDTTNWYTLSLTTSDFEVQEGDQVNGQMALMDWGTGKYRVDVDYYKVDVVEKKKTVPDLGNPIPYHPPVADPTSLQNHVDVAHDAMINRVYSELNFNNWGQTDGAENTRLLTVNGEQLVIMRWDLGQFKEKEVIGSGLLELTTFSLQRSPDFAKDFGMVRISEILYGDSAWSQESVSFDSFTLGKPLEEVVNTQMVIDWEVIPEKGGKTNFTLSKPVIQRLIDGRTLGLAVGPLGVVNASFYAMENGGDLAAKLHFSLK